MPKLPPVLMRTKAALATYDAWVAEHPSWDSTRSDAENWASAQEQARLAREVGIAFGHDTADRNDMDTCRACVRPGPWLREQVAKYGPKEE